MTESHTTRSVEETIRLGENFSGRLLPGSVVALYGELGSGKTHLVKGICRGLGVEEHVASPTFTIINEYHTPRHSICHVDCYRIQTSAELRETGFEEYLGNFICLIEWADRVRDLLPLPRFDIRLRPCANEEWREITIEEAQ
jgi:tRNA threonylcarbamoyladenosine biosynthesis protein TsaE